MEAAPWGTRCCCTILMWTPSPAEGLTHHFPLRYDPGPDMGKSHERDPVTDRSSVTVQRGEGTEGRLEGM